MFCKGNKNKDSVQYSTWLVHGKTMYYWVVIPGNMKQIETAGKYEIYYEYIWKAIDGDEAVSVWWCTGAKELGTVSGCQGDQTW